MIVWPDLYFGPVNLYTLPRTAMPHMYLEIEHKYCKNTAIEFLKEKQEEFNKLWNLRAKEG